ncbi:MAG: DUF4286 family protein [Sphingobacteriales bacterium]|jgi:hypothetical protein|nr:DUF4286 family protein [Sphingobacteriales bacterium]
MTIEAKIIYNVTTKVAYAIHDDWLQWIQKEHIPAMLATGCFSKGILLKLKEHDDEEGITYAVQYYAKSEDILNTYLDQFADDLRNASFIKWGDQFFSFRTIMEIVN